MTTLERILSEYGSQAKAAEAFGVTQGTISHWLSGRRRVSVDAAKRIEELSKGRYRADDLVFNR